MKKGQIIFLSIIALVVGYFLSSVLFFGLNHSFKKLPHLWYAKLSFDMIINGWNKAYLAYFLGNLISFALAFLIPFIPKKKSLHGEARFANSADVKKMDLYGNEGIIIGKYNGKLLRYGGQQFVSLGAPTRSGKGVGIVIPNLLDWKESAVVQDIKQECFDFTSGYRQKILGQEVYLFNPFDKRTHRYNPLAYIDMKGDNADAQLTDFANILYPMSGDSTTQFFNQLAQNLFIGLCYMVHDLLNSKGGILLLKELGVEIDFTLYGILQMSEGFKGKVEMDGLEIPFKEFEDTYNTLVALGLIGKKAQMRCQSYFKISSENTQSGVMSSFNAPLMMFRNDNMRLATSANDFDFRDLRKKKMTIYVGITPDQLANAKLILNIFWQQLILVNTKELPQANPDLRHKVALIMDEFTAPGYLGIYSKSISFIAGYWLRSLMIYQSNSQLETSQPNGYGKEEAKTLLANHACQIFYTPKQEDSKSLSEYLGNTTVKNRSRNLGQGGGGSESDTVRPLMLPQELREMPFEDELIMIDNGKPIMCNKAFYYSDRYFMNKFKEVSPSLRALDGEEYRKKQWIDIIDKKSKKVIGRKIKIKENGLIPNRNQLESAIQNGETNISVPMQSLKNIKEYFNELFDDNSDRFKDLPEIVRELDETQEEYDKKLRLSREKIEENINMHSINESVNNLNQDVENTDELTDEQIQKANNDFQEEYDDEIDGSE